MRFYQTIFVLISAFAVFSCGSNSRPETPLETFRAYTQAIKKKDAAAMKEYLSSDSIKMAQDEAKAQNVALDDIIRQETLFAEDQKTVEFRNEQVTGDQATLEVKDASGIWNSVQFVKENGSWKIDKKAFASNLEKQVDEDNKRLDEQIYKSRQQ